MGIGLYRLQGRFDLGRMVSVVVNHNGVDLADDVKALFDPLEVKDFFSDRLKLLAGSGRQNCQSCIKGDMRAKSPDFKDTHIQKFETGMRLVVDQHELDIFNVLARIKANRLAVKRRKKRIFCIEYPQLCRSNKGPVGIIKALEVVVIIFHMLRLGIGNDRAVGVGVQKASVTLIGFKKQDITLAVAHIVSELF